MKQARFRLDPVLEVRRVEERTAALKAVQAANLARDAEQVAHSREQAAADAVAPSTGDPVTFVATLVQNHRLAFDAAESRRTAAERHEQAAVEAANWTNAAQRVKGLERLKETHLAEVQDAATRAEERAVDDLVTRTYALRAQTEGWN